MQRERAYSYYLKVKDLPEYKEKVKLAKQQFYQNNKAKIIERERHKYNNDIEYRETIRTRIRLKYLEKTATRPKMKRGRKPKVIVDNATPLPI